MSLSWRSAECPHGVPACPVCLERLDSHISGIQSLWVSFELLVCQFLLATNAWLLRGGRPSKSKAAVWEAG